MRTFTITLLTILAILMVPSAQAAELHVGSSHPYATISTAVAAASADDTITVHAGTYTEPQLNITQQNLLLQGAPGEAMPTLISTSGQYSNMIVMNADGITTRGLEITHQSGAKYGYGIGDGNAGAAHSGWTIENCVIHDSRSAVWNNKASNFTFQGNEVYNNYSNRLYLEATESFVAKDNFFHSATRTSGRGVIWWYTGSDANASGDTVISGNYISGGRAAMVIAGQSADSPSGTRTLTIAHNTLDGMAGQWNQPGDYSSQLISFWDGSGNTYDADKIAIRDNLIVESQWYGIYNGESATGGLAGDVEVENSIFFNNYSNDSWYPDYAYPEEWTGPQGQVGWTETGDDFLFPGSFVADPLLNRQGDTAELYYALKVGSPALNSRHAAPCQRRDQP